MSSNKIEKKKESKLKKILKKKDIEISVQRYLIDVLGVMAQGLFASLINWYYKIGALECSYFN